MAKIFEDLFSELQTDMVSICLEYVDKEADKIYIYCSCEGNLVSSNFFFCIDGQIKKKHRLNECGRKIFNVSPERQDMVLSILIEDTKKIMLLCEEYNKPMPTEIKLIYNVKMNRLDANYQYELIHSNDPYKTPKMVADEWFVQLEMQKC